jgi:hypothetical protein
MNCKSTLYSLILILSSNLIVPCYGQIKGGDDGKHFIPLAKYQDLMTRPEGLLKVTNLIGDYSWNSPTEDWGHDDLPDLAKKSTVIVIATIKSRQGIPDMQLNTVSTIYETQIVRSLKGDVAGELKFKGWGGESSLSNGHTVTMHAPLYDNLKIGSSYVLFLSKTDKGYEPVHDTDGIFEVSSDTQRVHLMNPRLTYYPTYRTYENSQIQGLESEIKAAAQ